MANTGYVMTLANGIIGVGILAMPFCFQKCGIILSILLLIVSNWITRICCHYLIKSSLLTRRKSFEFLGFHAFGSSGKTLVELSVIGYLLGTCITYFVVVGDLGPQIVAKMFALQDDNGHLRSVVMIVVTVVCVLPLGMLKNVDSLSAVCTASIGFYVCLVMKIVLESEEHILVNDWTDKVVYWEPKGILQCLPIFSMALSCQMQLFEVFDSINNKSVEKLNGIVRNATWICTFVYIAVGFFGYVAFCTHTFSGNILVNFSTSVSSDVIKIGFILSIAFSFPLVIFPCRASIYSLLYRKGQTDATGYIPDSRFKTITTFIVAFALCIALIIPSVELIIGLVGSTIGVVICIMFPAACFRKIVKKDSAERSLAQIIMICGCCLMILGTYANLSSIDEKRPTAHSEPSPVVGAENIIMKPNDLSPSRDHVEDSVRLEEVKKKLAIDESKYRIRPEVKEAIAEQKSRNQQQQQQQEPQKQSQNSVLPDKEVNKAPELAPPSPPDPRPVDERVGLERKKPDSAGQSNLSKPMVSSDMEDQSKNAKAKSPIEAPNLREARNETMKIIDQQRMAEVISSPSQNIDNEAIKKDEEIAAEEQKNVDKKSPDIELKKAQNELKETKELLERTVDKLKEELEKSNREAQNLVVAKLGEVAEKVQQIERKVQENQKEEAAVPLVAAKNDAEDSVAGQPDPAKIKGASLLSILAESPSPAQAVKPGQVYEPLSYKTGELIEQSKNGSQIEQRLPLPLALLINASQAKANENQVRDEVKEAEDNVNKESVKSPVIEVNAERSKAPEPTPAKENANVVDIMRRDILQVNPKKFQDDGTTVVNPSSASRSQPESPLSLDQHRVKREADARTNFEAINAQIENDNCLTQPKIETLMSHALSGVIDLQMKATGRDLKAVKEEEQ